MILLQSLAIVYGGMFLLWLVSLGKRDVSIVDPFWSIAFLLPFANLVRATGATPGKLLLLALVALWALRLWAYLSLRARGKPEDPRYTAFREQYGRERYPWISLFQVFLLQGTLALIIGAPLTAAALAPAPDVIGPLDVIGGVLALGGTLYEAVADAQMAAYKRAPHGPVMDRGLWRWSRHPNYFGETVLWWGFWLAAADAPWGLATVFAPALMTFLLLRVSGVTLLEKGLRARKPEYEAYVRRTSAFLPRPPRD